MMFLQSLRQSIALAICPELKRELDMVWWEVTRLRWLTEERAQVVQQRAHQSAVESRSVGVGAVGKPFEAGNEAAVRAAWLAGERSRRSEDADFKDTAACLECENALFDGHSVPVLPVVGATEGKGVPGPDKGHFVPGRGALISLCEKLATHQGVTHFAISMRALGKGDFFKKLMDGGDCRTATAARVLAWFDANWPADLEWPRDIPRPAPKRRVV